MRTDTAFKVVHSLLPGQLPPPMNSKTLMLNEQEKKELIQTLNRIEAKLDVLLMQQK